MMILMTEACTKIGMVQGDTVKINNVIDISLVKLSDAYFNAMKRSIEFFDEGIPMVVYVDDPDVDEDERRHMVAFGAKSSQ